MGFLHRRKTGANTIIRFIYKFTTDLLLQIKSTRAVSIDNFPREFFLRHRLQIEEQL